MPPITPLPVFIAQLGHSIATFDDEIREVTVEVAEKVASDARGRVPERTGALAASIRTEKVAEAGVVGATVAAGGGIVDYAGFVEYGTARTPPQPYMRPAVDQALPDWESSVADVAEQLAAGRG